MEKKETSASKEKEEKLVHKEWQGLKVQKVQRDLKVREANLDLQDHQERKASLAFRVFQDTLGHQETKVIKEEQV